MNPLPIGTKVTIQESSKFFHQGLDISDRRVVGVVIQNSLDPSWRQDFLAMGWNTKVEWPHTSWHVYNAEKDLVVHVTKTFEDLL
jgi:hypothetical protein